MLILLNPFLVIVYLIDLLYRYTTTEFSKVIVQAGIISSIVFVLFAIGGNIFFENIIQAEFASFQVFGGIVFLLIALNFVFKGGAAIEILRGESKFVASAIAMPILIGPGTISYSIIIGQRLPHLTASLAIITSVAISVVTMIGLKVLYNAIHRKHEVVIERYIDISGRITAIILGTISIDLIMKGLKHWATC
jgi:small neutral amino acid transporter SnatA (MarC family)